MEVDSVLSIHLRAATEIAHAEVAALFVPVPGGRLELKAQVGIDQAGFDVPFVAWATQQRALQGGKVVRVGGAAVWPLVVEGQVAALVYLDHAHAGFPDMHEQLHGRVLAERVRRLGRARPIGPQVASVASRDADVRRQLEVVLRHVAGNVAAAARTLGVHRDTIYERAARLSIDIDDYRPMRRRGSRRPTRTEGEPSSE